MLNEIIFRDGFVRFFLIMVLPLNSVVAQQDVEEVCINKVQEKIKLSDEKFEDFILKCVEQSTDKNH
jgi:hypothetical protein